jgi:glycopeptide antibiotics resistance protein
MLDFDILSWLIGCVILALVLPFLWKQKRDLWYLFFFSVFWIYLLTLVGATIFPIPLDTDDAEFRFNHIWEQIAHMQRYHGINLIPLYFGSCWELPRPCAIGIYENILMTVPFGFGINFIARLKPKNIPWLGLVLGLAIETIQFVLDLALGGAYRTVDVNDVLLNAIGVLLGYGIFRIFAWLYLIITRRFRINHKGLLAYIYSVAWRAQVTNSEYE